MLNLENNLKFIEKSKKLIPGGSTFNKTGTFDQGKTPFSLVRGNGALVWDVDGNEYVDFISGLGTVILGYSFKEINDAIFAEFSRGESLERSFELQQNLSQRICSLVPSAEKVWFGKNGSDALGIAVRLAREITKNKNILTCGYHGWHSFSIANTSRSGGVPDSEKNLTHKFIYNDIDSLIEKIESLKGDVACVVMDIVARYSPEEGFLEEVRKITKEKGIILIFDEVVTGFRIDLGGAQKYFGVTPDLSIFGKAIANGMPLSALVGKQEYMEKLDSIICEHAFSDECLSLAAADAVLSFLEKAEVPNIIFEKGSMLRKKMSDLILDYSLEDVFEVQGIEHRNILGFRSLLDSDFLKKKSDIINSIYTYMVFEFAQKGILYNSSMMINYSHTDKQYEFFLNTMDEVFKGLKNTTPRQRN